MKKLILCCLFGLSAIVCQAADLEINSLSDLLMFRERVNNGISTYSGQTVALNCDLNVGSWTPIGLDNVHTFQGTFEGNGHTVIIDVNTDGAVAGFFGYLRGTVQNLKVAGTVICTNTTTSAAGGIAGYNHGGTISECANLATVIGYICGGITGENAGGTISNCYNTGYIGSNGSATLLAGIAGNNAGTIDHVYASCTVEAISVSYAGITASCTLGKEPTNAFYNVKTDKGATLDGSVTLIGDALNGSLNNTIWQFTDGLPELTNMYSHPVYLLDDADNLTFLSTYQSQTRTVKLTGRTLYKDGKWNTICLPFNVTIAGSTLAGAEARTLTAASIDIEGTTLNLTFGDAVTTLVADTPYIIKWTSGDNIGSPEFTGVTIDVTERPAVFTDVTFRGTYEYMPFDADDQSILFLGDDNKLFYPQKGANIGACRAYFKLSDPSGVREFNLNFDEQGTQTTGIIGHTEILRPDGSKRPKVERTDSTDKAGAAWYTINGVKLDSKPSSKGIYIHGNKKVVVE